MGDSELSDTTISCLRLSIIPLTSKRSWIKKPNNKKTIDNLKNQITHAWKLADAAHAREQLAQEIIDNLRRQVENLNAEIDFRNKLNQDTEEMGELSKHKDGLERERDRLINEVTQLNTKLQNALGYQEELERKTRNDRKRPAKNWRQTWRN
nr:unnamed protein product [Callosobruchus analis]